MNRRGFIRSALAATLGVAAGVLMPKTPVETVVESITVSNNTPGVYTFKFIEDVNCPEGVIYFLPANFNWKVQR